MKKFFSILACTCFFAFGAMSQEQGQIGASLGLAFGSEAGLNDDGEQSGGLGINVGFEYFVTDVISVAPSFTYFFGEEVEAPGFRVSYNLSAINIDGRYYFLTDDLKVYGLIGPSILIASSESTFDNFFGQTITTEDSDSEFGINIGGGIVYPIADNLGLGAQLKYQTPYDGQLVLNGGLTYTF